MMVAMKELANKRVYHPFPIKKSVGASVHMSSFKCKRIYKGIVAGRHDLHGLRKQLR
jgi:hypothetical protein